MLKRGDGELKPLYKTRGTLLLTDLLDALEELHVVLRDESNGFARAPGACRAAHSVNVVFGMLRHVEIHNHIHMGNIQAARRDIGRHQNIVAL